MREFAVGIDIGGTSTTVGIVDKTGIRYLNEKNTLKPRDYKTQQDYVDDLCKTIKELIDKAGGINKIEGIGIGAPSSANLPWSGDFPIVKMIEEQIELNVHLDNDANVAAFGEWIYGGGKGLNDFIMITLGTGLGSGIVSEGKLLRGKNKSAGELGHIIVRRSEGRRCGCGRYGCLETYASAKGVARTAIEFLEVSKADGQNPANNILRDIYIERKNKGLLALQAEGYKEDILITAKDVSYAAKNGDSTAKEIFEYTGKILGEALADNVAFTDPGKIFVFGGLANAGELILEPTRRYMDAAMLFVYEGKVTIEVSKLNGDDNAAILGASALVWEGK